MAPRPDDHAPSFPRTSKDAMPAVFVGVPFCIAFYLASIVIGTPIIGLSIVAWKSFWKVTWPW